MTFNFSRHFLLLSAFALSLTACSHLNESATQSPQQTKSSAAAPIQPESASAYTIKKPWFGKKWAVASAHPLATEAGYQMLQKGGSALDSAIAVQMVLALVEPQSSGIGGGAFLLHFDGRETAPALANENLFLNAQNQPMAFKDAVVGGRSVGVPGVVRMLENAHLQHGKLPWAQLFEPAIVLAENGFPVSQRLHSLLSKEMSLRADPTAFAYFYDANGEPWQVGHLLKNPELARVLKNIAKNGSKALLEGEVAQAIVDKVQKHPTNSGLLTLSDLAQYKMIEREPLCFDYSVRANAYQICGMPPPSSGTLAIGQMLGLLNQTNAHDLPLEKWDGANVPSANWLHLYTESARLAFADRAQYVADSAFVSAPANNWLSLLEPRYLQHRALLIQQQSNGKSMKQAQAGDPAAFVQGSKLNSSASDSKFFVDLFAQFAPMPDQPEYGTSHISVMDDKGRAVSMTTTIEDAFGSRLMVKGFLLNNELTDFSLSPRNAEGLPIANRVEGGKRPRSSMSPIFVFDQKSGELLLSLGSPGGAPIIHYTAKTLYGILNWRLHPQLAIDLPNFGSLNGPTLLEENRFPPKTAELLRERNHEVREQNLTSGLQAIQKNNKELLGGADPRREGVVLGD